MNLENYKTVTYEADSKGYGLAVLVKLPDGEELTETLKSKIVDAHYKLYEDMRWDTHKNDPKVSEYNKKVVEELKSLFDEPIFVEEVPNEYTKFGAPWLKVTTKVGRFKVGYRHHVIVIDWSEAIVEAGTADEIFPDEKVTKGFYSEKPHFIHAWSLEKGREYIKKIIEAW